MSSHSVAFRKGVTPAPCGLHALFLLTLHAALSLALGLFPWPMGTRQYSAEYLGESLHVPRSFLCRSVLRARLTFLAGLWVPSLPQVRRVAWVHPSWVRAWRLSLGKQQGSCRTPLLSRGAALEGRYLCACLGFSCPTCRAPLTLVPPLTGSWTAIPIFLFSRESNRLSKGD